MGLVRPSGNEENKVRVKENVRKVGKEALKVEKKTLDAQREVQSPKGQPASISCPSRTSLPVQPVKDPACHFSFTSYFYELLLKHQFWLVRLLRQTTL